MHFSFRFNLVVYFCFFIFCSNGHAQDVQKKVPQTKFARPALTNVVLSNTKAEALVREMKKIQPQARFDDHSVEYASISLTFPSEDEIMKDVKTLNPIKALKEFAVKRDSICGGLLRSALSPVANKAVAKWWGRDKNGNMTDSIVNFRGLNTATDADVITDKASENSRLANLGYELLNKSYIAVYEISKLRTMTEVYDAIDAARKKTAEKTKKPFTPVERKEEGWYIDYNAYILKIEWSDSLQTIFWENLWVDANTKENRAQRIANFDKNSFPLQFVTTVSGLVISTQSNNPDDYGPLKGKRLSMEELLVKAAPDFQEDALFKASKRIEDFRTRAPFFTTYPNTIKLGTKEGIYTDQRFFAYEMQLDAKGNKVAKRKAVLRPSKIVKNDGLASGESPASTFRQQGGRKVYSGMFVEMKEDFGVNIMPLVKYDLNSGAMSYGAVLEANIPRNYRRALKSSAPSFLAGVHLGLFASVGTRTYEKVSDFSFADSSGNGYDVSELVEGTVSATLTELGGYFGKEIYLLPKGNLYIYPQVGVVSTTLSYDKIVFEDFDLEFDLNGDGAESEEDGPNDFSRYSASAGIGIGYHITPWLSIIATPTYFIPVTDWTNSKDFEIAPKIDEKMESLSIFGGLRFKF